MNSATINERNRLEALRALGLLDTPPEERFDRITRVASHALHAPIALISLIDLDRQWFKSKVGLNVSETPREFAFCATAIESVDEDLFVVEDAQADIRFFDNPLVVGDPHIRFYAGRVVRDASGLPMGTMCVIDREPRMISPAEAQLLLDLGAMVEHELTTHNYNEAVIALERSERSKEYILSSLNEGLVLHSLDGAIVEWNLAAEEVLGLPAEQLSGRTPIDPRWRAIRADHSPWPGEDHPASRALNHGTVVTNEVMGVYRPDDSLVWLRVGARPTFDTAGVISGAVAAFQDITSEIQLEAEFTASLAFAQRAEMAMLSLAESLPIGVFRSRPNGKCIYANSRWLEAYDVSDPNEFGWAWLKSIHEDDLDRVLTELARSKGSREPFESSFRVRDRHGKIRYVRGTAQATWSASDSEELIGFVGSVEDITERRRTEEELATTALQLARTNNELAQFASIAAHDLAEPLRVIEGYLDLLQLRSAHQLDEVEISYIHRAIEGADRLQQLIDDLLAYSLATDSVGTREPVDLGRVVDNALESLALIQIETSASITVSGPLPTVRGSEIQLTRVFQNLFANSLKFVAPDVVPDITVTGAPNSEGFQIDVIDNGIGISPEHHERVFGMFKRLNGRDSYPGTGIGLAICRKLIEAHGGGIWIEDRTHGTHFRIQLPEHEGSTESTERLG